MFQPLANTISFWNEQSVMCQSEENGEITATSWKLLHKAAFPKTWRAKSEFWIPLCIFLH